MRNFFRIILMILFVRIVDHMTGFHFNFFIDPFKFSSFLLDISIYLVGFILAGLLLKPFFKKPSSNE